VDSAIVHGIISPALPVAFDARRVGTLLDVDATTAEHLYPFAWSGEAIEGSITNTLCTCGTSMTIAIELGKAFMRLGLFGITTLLHDFRG
jgi:hypothetical protein